MCGHSKEEHDYRKRPSQWPKQKYIGEQTYPGQACLELRNCESGGTMAVVLWENKRAT